jgi:hypothetical protein
MKIGKITTIGQLRERIRDLEHQDYVNQQHMRTMVVETADRFKPANIFRNLVSKLFFDGHETKMGLLRLAAGIATSFIVKKFFRKKLQH